MPFNNKAKFSLIVSIFSAKTSKTRLGIPVIHLTKIKAYLSKTIQFCVAMLKALQWNTKERKNIQAFPLGMYKTDCTTKTKIFFTSISSQQRVKYVFGFKDRQCFHNEKMRKELRNQMELFWNYVNSVLVQQP